MSRRRLLATGGTAALAGALLGTGVASAQSTGPIGVSWNIDIENFEVTPTSIDGIREASRGQAFPTGPWHAAGRGTTAGGVAVVAHGTGWSHDGRTGESTFTGVIDIARRGQIVFAGLHNPSRAHWLPIVGGTGDFQNTRGQVFIAPIGPTPTTRYSVRVRPLGVDDNSGVDR